MRLSLTLTLVIQSLRHTKGGWRGHSTRPTSLFNRLHKCRRINSENYHLIQLSLGSHANKHYLSSGACKQHDVQNSQQGGIVIKTMSLALLTNGVSAVDWCYRILKVLRTNAVGFV